MVDNQVFNKLVTKALENKQTRYITSFPKELLKEEQRKWRDYIVEQLSTYGYIPSPEQMSRDVSTFLPMSSELPLDRLFNDTANLLQAEFYQEELTAFMERNRRSGKPPLDGIRDFTEHLRTKSTVLQPTSIVYNDFSRDEYRNNMRRSVFGIKNLDAATKGVVGGDYFLTIGGFKSGKTTTLLTLARIAFESLNENIVVCAMESSPSQMAAQFDAMFGRMPVSKFRQGLDDVDMERLRVVEKAVRNKDNRMVITPRITHPHEIVDVLESLPWDVHKIFIDGVNLLGNRNAIDMNQQTVGLMQASRLLKEIALKKNVAIIGVTQANRSGAKSSETPEATDVGGSIALAQDCDGALSTKFVTTVDGAKGVKNRLILNRWGDTEAVEFLVKVDYNTSQTTIHPMVADGVIGEPTEKFGALKELERQLQDSGVDTENAAAQAIIRELTS